jgi:hypothetical protein
MDKVDDWGDTTAHEVYDNTFSDVDENDCNCSTDHGNVMETDNEPNGPNLFYNNVTRHIGNIAAIGVNWWPNGPNDFFYNNLMYDVNVAGNNYFDFQPNGGEQDTLYNNTFERSSGYIFGDLVGSTCTNPIAVGDNLWITGDNSVYQCGSVPGQNTDRSMTESQATAAGYTSANAYAPTSASAPTVGAGTNLTSKCTNLPNLCRDTTLAVGETSDHQILAPMRYPHPRPTSGPWDQGAYSYQ